MMHIAPGVGLSAVMFTTKYNSQTDALDCTIVSFSVDGDHCVKGLDGASDWMGGCLDLEAIDIYFGGDTTFSIYIDYDTKTLKCDEIPCILDEYKDAWPENS